MPLDVILALRRDQTNRRFSPVRDTDMGRPVERDEDVGRQRDGHKKNGVVPPPPPHPPTPKQGAPWR